MTVGVLAPVMLGPSGYAHACRSIIFGLVDLGVTVKVLCQNALQYDGIISREEYQRLQELTREGSEPDIYFNLSPQCNFSRVSQKPTIGMTMWEGLEHPERFKTAVSIVDELWVSSLHDFLCFQEYSLVPREKIALMPLGVDPDRFSPDGQRFGIESEDGETFDFIFGIVCGYSTRKGVDLLERAFLSNFSREESVALLIKGDAFGVRLIGPDLVEAQEGLHPSALPLILYHFEPMLDSDIPMLLRGLDCFVFPSRGEGQGLPPLEAMSVGLPTIVTDATGLADFAFEETCFPIDSLGWSADPRAWWITGEYRETQFAVPDYQQLCSAMRDVFDHREEAAARGVHAREFILRNRTSASLVRRMLRRMEQVVCGSRSTAEFGPETLELDCPDVRVDETNSRFRYASQRTLHLPSTPTSILPFIRPPVPSSTQSLETMVILYVTQEIWTASVQEVTLKTLSPILERGGSLYMIFPAEADSAEEVCERCVVIKTLHTTFWLGRIIRVSKPVVVVSSDVEYVRRVDKSVRVVAEAEDVVTVLDSFTTGASINVLLLSSWGVACGIAEYSKALIQSLSPLINSVNIRPFSAVRDYAAAILDAFPRPDIVQIQFDPSFVTSEHDFLCGLEFVRERAPEIGIVLTAHHYDEGVYGVYGRVVDRIIIHRPWGDLPEKVIHLPQGCRSTPLVDKVETRARFALPQDTPIFTSFGFAMPWKLIPDFFNALVPYLVDHNIFGQFLHAAHNSCSEYAQVIAAGMQQLSIENNIQDKVFITTEFLDDDVIMARLQASDVGVVFGSSLTTGSSSAALKQFVSARLPIVACDITHYRDLSGGVSYVPPDPVDLARETVALLQDPERLLQLREEQEKNYEELNFDAFAGRHVEIYKQILIERRTR